MAKTTSSPAILFLTLLLRIPQPLLPRPLAHDARGQPPRLPRRPHRFRPGQKHSRENGKRAGPIGCLGLHVVSGLGLHQTLFLEGASLLRRFLRVFSQSGTLRDVVKAVQTEVVEGELLKDCLELGSGDFQGVLQILKDLGLQYGSASESKHQEL